MSPKFISYLFGMCCLGCISSASAQIDGSAFADGLRAKYGPPNRVVSIGGHRLLETFIGRPGIEIVVHYTANLNVCRIELPPYMASTSEAPPSEAVDDFLAELV